MNMKKVRAHLKLREGIKYRSYKDSLGKLTGGVGHLLSPLEATTYPEGSQIAPKTVEAWLVGDIDLAWKAAERQAIELAEPSQELVEALIHINFQLGTGWNKIHKKTWKLMTQGRYRAAAREAANSVWYRQTPVRVEDFQKALIKEATRNIEMKDKLIALAKQKTTWIGVAALAGALLGLPAGSGEQIVTLILGVIGIIYPEKVEK